jgi:hypothetical protein
MKKLTKMLKIVFLIKLIIAQRNQNALKITCLTIIIFLIEGCHSNIQDLKQKYSTEVINYFYETVFFQDNTGKIDKVNKWDKDIYAYVSGNFSTNDMTNIKTIISQLDSLLPINMYLTSDSSLANLFVYFGDYPYLEEKINIQIDDYEPFVGMGVFRGNPYIESAVVGFANNAKRYKRLGKTDSTKLRHAIILEELTQCLGIIGDSFHYPNSAFFEGGILVPSLSVVDKGVLTLLYETSITSQYSRLQFEKDFGDVLHHINAPQKIADYVLANNIQLHLLEYIREKCFHDSILIKCPSEIHISLKGDFSQEDSVFCRNVVTLFNSVSNYFQLVFADNIAHEVPGINICYEYNNKRNTTVERQMITDNMMFPRRLKGEIKATYRIQDAQKINRLIFNSIYKLLGFDSNNADDILKLDTLGNISFKPDYKEMLKLIYEPVFYSGLTIKEFDKAIEILKTKGYNKQKDITMNSKTK